MKSKLNRHVGMKICITVSDADYEALQATLKVAKESIDFSLRECERHKNVEGVKEVKSLERKYRKAEKVMQRMVWPMVEVGKALEKEQNERLS